MNHPLHPLIRCLAIGLVAGGIAWAAEAQDFLTAPAPIRSHSGQFVIHAQREVAHPSWIAANLATNRTMLRLDPPLVAVSCERIKQNLRRELGEGNSWQGRIYVELRRTPFNEQNITITSERFRNGWQFQLELPDPVDRVRYVRSIVQVLLLEMANHDSNGRLAEVPFWLAEGLTQKLLASSEMEIILAPPKQKVNGLNVVERQAIEARENPVNEARAKLGTRSALTFEELSWPSSDAALNGTNDLFSASAQMFVGELLTLQDGKACLRSMVSQLPKYYNWQFAFLNAFQKHFGRPLDVEKWWALSVATSRGKDTAKIWSSEETWRRFDEATLVYVDVRSGTNAPVREPWTFQGIIRNWRLDRQSEALTTKLLELDTIAVRASLDVAPLVQDYYQVLSAYLRNEHKSQPITQVGKALGLSGIGKQTIERLDALDNRRRALHPVPTPIADASPARARTAP